MKILQFYINQGVYIFLLLFCIIALSNTALTAQVKFSAVCQNKKIGKNDYLQLQYIVENASRVDQILPPGFKDFSIVSGPNQQSGMSNINGNIRQYIALEFILKPQKPGNFTFSPATAKVDGKNLLSNSLTIEVTNNSSLTSSGGTAFSPFANIMADVIPAHSLHQYDDYILKNGENVAEKIKKNLFINVTVNKTACYVGEPVVASYKLYTRLKSESNLTKSPSFNGFSVSEMEMPDNYNISTEKFKGREYSVYTLRKVQLYPLQPGTVELEPIEVENTVTFLKAGYADARRADMFYDILRDFAEATAPRGAIEEQKITLQSKPLNIVIKPLPELTQPKEFKGAVGTFNIAAGIEKKTMTTDEAGNLVITISGNGNIQMVNAPVVLWPDGLETFEPKSSETIDKTTVPLKGKKTFNYAFTAARPGTYSIPPVVFSYFDITSHSYKTISTSPFTVTIKQGRGIKRAIAAHLSKAEKDRLHTFLERTYHLRWTLLALLILTGVFFWWVKRTKNGNTKAATLLSGNNNSQKKEVPPLDDLYGDTPIQNPLHEAEAVLSGNDANNFYHAIDNCIRKYLSVKLKFPEKELTKKKISELLDIHNVGVGTTLMLTSLLENIELNLYAPFSSADQKQQVFEKASEVVALLDKQLC